MVPLKDVQPLTGYIRGGVTVFGAKKPYPVFVDETADPLRPISVSAGARGTQLILSRRLSPRARPRPKPPTSPKTCDQKDAVAHLGEWVGRARGPP
jgi:hypothetical protein